MLFSSSKVFIQISLILSFFLFQGPILDVLHLVMSLSAPLDNDSFSDFTCFWWPCEFWWALLKYFIGCPSFCRDLFNVFLMLKLRLWVWGRKTTEIKCHFHHIRSREHSVNMIYHCWCWLWSSGWGSACQVSPLSGYFFSLSLLCPLEGSLCAVHT